MPQPLLVLETLTQLNFLRAKLTDSTVLEERTPTETIADLGAIRHETRIQLTAPGITEVV